MKSLVATIFAATLLAAPALAQAPAAPPPERDADYHNRQNLYLYSLNPADGWRSTISGLRDRKVSGTADGPRPSITDRVTIHYVGRFIDGREFDSSRTRGEPATFPLNRLIKGWQEGVPMMRVGEVWEFLIPADLAYGERTDRAPIPPGSALQFEIELIALPEA